MNDRTAQAEVIAFLADRLSYDGDIKTIERHETHGAIVFLAGERAYKLKRAVKFPYMDYSTVELRKQMCMREFAINKRMAPELYIDVLPIVRNGDALGFGRRQAPKNAMDWVVVMRRFDQSALLESMRRSGKLTTPLMRLVAEAVARAHSDAEVVLDFGGETAIRDVIANNVALLKSRIDCPFHCNQVVSYEAMASQTLTRVASLLEERRKQGYVRRCHGDLHLNNIFASNAGPILFDAIEFNDQFSCIDVLYDLSFLLMDLDRHELRPLANTVFNRYLELSADHQGLAAVSLFLSCRAAIRAHTSVATSEAIEDQDRKHQLLQDAAALLQRAIDYLADDRPRLVAIGGVSGTGKSTLAYSLAPCLGRSPGAVVLRTDVIRKQLAGVADTARLPQTAYTAALSDQVYGRVAEIASSSLAAGFTTIVDAVYGKEHERVGIAELAHRANARFDGLWLEAPQAVLEQRVAARVGDASDATVSVLRSQLGLSARPTTWTPINAAGSALDSLQQAQRLLAH